MRNFSWPYQGLGNGCRVEAHRSHTVFLHVEHALAIDSPATHEQLANGLSNTDPRGHAIVSGLSCASGRLINNITALLTHQRHNVFFNTCRVLLNWGLRYKSLGSRAALLKWTVSAVLLVQVFEGGAGACRCRLAGSGYRHLCFRYEAMNRTCICGMAK